MLNIEEYLATLNAAKDLVRCRESHYMALEAKKQKIEKHISTYVKKLFDYIANNSLVTSVTKFVSESDLETLEDELAEYTSPFAIVAECTNEVYYTQKLMFAELPECILRQEYNFIYHIVLDALVQELNKALEEHNGN